MANKKEGFHHPMNHTEAIVGWVYVFVHIFAMPFLLNFLNSYLFPALGFSVGDTTLNLIYYITGFFFLLVFMFSFWRESFANMCGNLINTLVAVVVGYFAYIVLSFLVDLLLSTLLESLVNPNSAAVSAATKLNPNVMLAVGVFLAPVVEETLFRGVVFGTIRRRSRVAAYLVSTLLFSFYHLWQYLLRSFSPVLLLYLLQYLPAGLVLGWCYDYGGSVWCPVFLHMVINYVSVSVTIG